MRGVRSRRREQEVATDPHERAACSQRIGATVTV